MDTKKSETPLFTSGMSSLLLLILRCEISVEKYDIICLYLHPTTDSDSKTYKYNLYKLLNAVREKNQLYFPYAHY